MIEGKVRIFFIALIIVVSGTQISKAQSVQASDTARPQGTGMEYSGVKEVKTNEGNTKSGLPVTNGNERVVNDTELTYSGNWEFDRLLARSSG